MFLPHASSGWLAVNEEGRMHTHLLMRARAPAAGALHRAGGIQGIRGWHFRPYFCKEQPLRFCEVYPPCRPATRVGRAGCASERAQASAGWLVPAALQPQRSASASHQMQTTVGTTTQACRQAMCGIPLEKWTLLLLQLLCPRSAAAEGPAGFTEAAAHHTTEGAGTACRLPAGLPACRRVMRRAASLAAGPLQ